MHLRHCLRFIILVLLAGCAGTPRITSSKGSQTIHIAEKIVLGGYSQWVLIRSHDVIRNPVLLLLHGGPGASETGMFRKYNHELEKHFTVVYWDQRGAGKSYSKKLDHNTLTLNQLISDTHELTAHLTHRFHQKKIFLLGHSWGSRLGMYVVRDRPQDYYAFVSVGADVASYSADSLSYDYTLKEAQRLKLKKALRDLEYSGPPVNTHWDKMYKNGFHGGVRQKHWLLKVGGERFSRTNYRDWIWAVWMSREYTFFDMFRWANGSIMSAGTLLSDSTFTPFDLRKEVSRIYVPICFISGIKDYNTCWPLAKAYYDLIEAPHKEFILFERSGHSPPFEEPEKFNSVLIEKLLPLHSSR